MSTPDPIPSRKSRGHIGFGPKLEGGLFEYFEASGQIWRADASNVLDCRTGYRLGARWSCSHDQWNTYFRQACELVA